MPAFFIPPTAPTRPMAVHHGHPGFELFKFYRPIDAGINVFLLLDGSVTTVEPDTEFGVDTVIRRTFHGGHIHPVDAAEVAALTAAGFTVTEIADAPVITPLPGFVDVDPNAGLYPGYEEGYVPFGGMPSGFTDVSGDLPDVPVPPDTTIRDEYIDGYTEVYGASPGLDSGRVEQSSDPTDPAQPGLGGSGYVFGYQESYT